MTTYTVNNTEQEKKIYCGREYEHDLTTNTQYNYIYVGDMPIALYVQGDSNVMYTLHTNYIGSIEKISDTYGNVVDSMSYTPFGQRRMFSDWSKADTATHFTDRGFIGQQHLDNFALINFNGRMYDPVLAHFLSPDPYIQSPENPLNYNRYAYCLFSPLQYTDPSGEVYNPIFDWQGNFLGTDDKGIQGEAIIMNAKDFVQNMSHEEALKKGYRRSELPDIMFELMNKIDAQTSTFSNRPDWDGYLTLSEANDWYRNGNGESLYADLSKINLSWLLSLGEHFVNQEKVVNLFFASTSINDALVYGSIKLKRYSNHKVRAFSDTYDFDMKPWWNPLNWGRNIETIIGSKVAGQGTPYEINFYGNQQLTPILPWIK